MATRPSRFVSIPLLSRLTTPDYPSPVRLLSRTKRGPDVDATNGVASRVGQEKQDTVIRRSDAGRHDRLRPRMCIRRPGERRTELALWKTRWLGRSPPP